MIVGLGRVTTLPSVRAVATLLGGQSVAIAVPILAAPILGRLYAPADYGALAQYMAPAALLSVLASLQFQHAIIAERTDRSARRVAWLVLFSSLVVAGLTILIATALWEPLLSKTAAGLWFAALPFSVAGAGVIATGQFLANRYRHYRSIASIQAASVLATVALSITLGVQGWGADGLLGAYFLGQLVQICSYLWLLRSLGVTTLPRPTASQFKIVLRRHWKFPVFTLPAEFSGQLNMQAPVFALTIMGSDATLGAFNRARQLVSMPVNVLGNSVSQVFRREASEAYYKTGSCRTLMLRTAAYLFAMGLIPCLLFIAFAPWLFMTYLGTAWREAGEISRILAPMLLLQLIVSPISAIYYIAGRQSEDLVLTLISNVLMAAGMTTAVLWANDVYIIVYLFSGILSIIYAVYFVRAVALSEKTPK